MLTVVIPFKASDNQELSWLYKLISQLTQNNSIVDEIIIVNSCRFYVEQEFCKNPKVIVINAPDSKVGEARKIGVKHAKNNFILFLDSDCELPEVFLPQIRYFVNELSEEIAAIGGPVKCIQSKSLLQRYLDYSVFSYFPHYEKEYIASWETFHKHHHPNMSNLIVRKNLFLKLGGCWKEMGEDVYYLLNATKLGYRVKYHPAMLVYHNHPDSLLRLISKYNSLGSSAAKLFLAFPTSPLMRHRLIRVIRIFLPGFFLMFVLNAYFGVIAFVAPLFILYIVRIKNFKAALLCAMLDMLLQLIYAVSFTCSLIRELIGRLKIICLRKSRSP